MSPTQKKSASPDASEFSKVREAAQRAWVNHTERINRIAKYSDVFQGNWDFDPSKYEGNWVQKLPSPKPHMDIKGIARLFEGAKITLKARSDSDDTAHKGEVVAVCRALLKAADRRGPFIPLYDLAMSGALYGEAYVRVINVEDNIKYLEDSAPNGPLAKRYRRLKKEKPFIFKVYPPGTVVPEYSDLGLESITVRADRDPLEFSRFWGAKALEGAKTTQRVMAHDMVGGEVITTWEHYSHEGTWVWVEGQDEPLHYQENELGFIPWAGSIIEGTSLFSNPEDQRLPILYPVVQSGYWHAQSYADTMIYSLAMTIGKFPQVVAQLMDPENKSRQLIDFSVPMGVWRIGREENITWLDKTVIDESLAAARDLARSYMATMTIPEQVLGGTPEHAMAFAAINLLVQAGRLPLVPIQRMVANILSQALELPFLWAKSKKQVYEIPAPEKMLTIDPQKYENVSIEVSLHAQFAQDDAQRVGVAANAEAAGYWSRERAMEYTGVEDPGQEAAKIDDERRHLAEEGAMNQNRIQQLTQIGANMMGMAAGTMMEPSKVMYRPGEDAIRLCGNCMFFRGPGVPCKVVNTQVDPIYTCNEWQPANEMFQQAQGMDQGGGMAPPPEAPPAIMDPNQLQGGGGGSPASAAPGLTREMQGGVDRAGNPIATGGGLPLV